MKGGRKKRERERARRFIVTRIASVGPVANKNSDEGDKALARAGALFYGELYPGDIKYLITRYALKRGNFCYRLSAGGCAQR